MGNSLSVSVEERKRFGEEVGNLQSFELPILDVGNRNGSTGYIDYIVKSDITGHMAMKGNDCFGRFFLTFETTAYFEDGSSEKYLTTFFQRYNDNKLIWHTAGHDEKLLFTTDGGATLEQVLFLNKLFKNGEVSGDDIVRLNGQILESDLYPLQDQSKITPKPTYVKLGWD